MKKLILRMMLFLMPIVLLSYGIDVFLSKNLKKSNHMEAPVWRDIYAGKIDSKVVIYGSSRAWVQIDPSMIGSSLNTTVYNLGIDGHNFWLQYFRHKMLLKYNAKPKLIVYSVDAFTLQKREELYESNQFLPDMLWNNDIYNATKGYKGFNFLDYSVPLLRYYGMKDELVRAMEIAISPRNNYIERVRGYEGKDLKWNSNFKDAIAKIKSYKIVFHKESEALFEQFLQECAQKNIKIVFVYAPEYIEGQKFIENRAEVIDRYVNLSKKYDIPFYDYSQDSISFDKQYFYNALHLNRTGAELFTSKLIKQLKETAASL
jgi:hypothetical protein